MLITLLTVYAQIALAATPMPNPSPSVKPARHTPLKSVPLKKVAPLKIVGKDPVVLMPAPTFDLIPTTPVMKSSGSFVLRFRPKNNGEVISFKEPFFIQLLAGSTTLKLKPDVIKSDSFVKNSTQTQINYSGATVGKRVSILGSGALTVCQAGPVTKTSCRKVKSRIYAEFTPSP